MDDLETKHHLNYQYQSHYQISSDIMTMDVAVFERVLDMYILG